MSISLYKPNSKNTGCAFNFSIGKNKKKEPVIYVNAIQQFSWDDKKKIASFSGNANDSDKKINLKNLQSLKLVESLVLSGIEMNFHPFTRTKKIKRQLSLRRGTRKQK